MLSAKFNGGWAKLNPAVTGAAMLGWTLPSSIPVSGFDGNSLTGKFIGSMFTELGHFPVRTPAPGMPAGYTQSTAGARAQGRTVAWFPDAFVGLPFLMSMRSSLGLASDPDSEGLWGVRLTTAGASSPSLYTNRNRVVSTCVVCSRTQDGASDRQRVLAPNDDLARGTLPHAPPRPDRVAGEEGWVLQVDERVIRACKSRTCGRAEFPCAWCRGGNPVRSSRNAFIF